MSILPGSPLPPDELVVLLSEDGAELGTAPKATVHTTDTPLHRAFSCHIFNDEGDVLLTRRALSKKTWPGVWTTSVCGHPGPGESDAAAIARRVAEELGTTVTAITVIAADYRYRAVDASGVVEYEICPVYRAVLTAALAPNPDEVAEYTWVTPDKLLTAVRAVPAAFSPWLGEQIEFL